MHMGSPAYFSRCCPRGAYSRSFEIREIIFVISQHSGIWRVEPASLLEQLISITFQPLLRGNKGPEPVFANTIHHASDDKRMDGTDRKVFETGSVDDFSGAWNEVRRDLLDVSYEGAIVRDQLKNALGIIAVRLTVVPG